MLLEKWQVAWMGPLLLFCFPHCSSLLLAVAQFLKLLGWRLCVLTLAPPPPWQVSRSWMRKRILFVTLLKKLSGFWVPENRRKGSIRNHFLSMNGHSHQESCSSLLRWGANLTCVLLLSSVTYLQSLLGALAKEVFHFLFPNLISNPLPVLANK